MRWFFEGWETILSTLTIDENERKLQIVATDNTLISFPMAIAQTANETRASCKDEPHLCVPQLMVSKTFRERL